MAEGDPGAVADGAAEGGGVSELNAHSVRVKGHAFKGFECNVYGDKRYVCECGDTGFPTASTNDVRWEHRQHKLAVLARNEGSGT